MASNSANPNSDVDMGGFDLNAFLNQQAPFQSQTIDTAPIADAVKLLKSEKVPDFTINKISTKEDFPTWFYQVQGTLKSLEILK